MEEEGPRRIFKEPQITKSNKPSNNAFQQQRFAAWHPIINAGTCAPVFFIIGLLFIPGGIGLWFLADNNNEISIDYTDCESNKEINGSSFTNCADVLMDDPNLICICFKEFKVEKELTGKISIYYGLTNFYQNHRLYVKSRDDKQLRGDFLDSNGIAIVPSGDCKPDKENLGSKYYLPCGAIANSMFSDTINISRKVGDNWERMKLERRGIAWESDKKHKFGIKNHERVINENDPMWKNDFKKPDMWRKELYQLDPEDADNNGLRNEDLIVWMRSAALPNFRKLYRFVNRTEEAFKDGLPIGEYRLEIDYAYNVKEFRGTKSIIITEMSLFGAKNTFLGISYLAVGVFCMVFGVVFLILHLKTGKRWNFRKTKQV